MTRTYRVITLTDLRPDRDTPHRVTSRDLKRSDAISFAGKMLRLREEQGLTAHVIVGSYDSRGYYMTRIWEDFTDDVTTVY